MKLMHTTEAKSIIDLQARDKAIDDLAGRIVSIPAEILALNTAFEEKKSSMNTAREELVRLKVNRKAKELSVAEKEEEIRKHHRDLNTIKNNDAYKALQLEIGRGAKGAG
jgi:predicted  nucleic acid-binding Zn-ribbon protein